MNCICCRQTCLRVITWITTWTFQHIYIHCGLWIVTVIPTSLWPKIIIQFYQIYNPADTICWMNVVLMLGQRRRRWTNIKTTLIQRLGKCRWEVQWYFFMKLFHIENMLHSGTVTQLTQCWLKAWKVRQAELWTGVYSAHFPRSQPPTYVSRAVRSRWQVRTDPSWGKNTTRTNPACNHKFYIDTYTF